MRTIYMYIYIPVENTVLEYTRPYCERNIAAIIKLEYKPHFGGTGVY